ncbi:MAG: tyrosine-type recombinase/integrase [Candidatus Sulfotelmatobacter sp.]
MLYRRGKTWHYDFTVAGHRQRGTTRQTSESRARKVESKLIEEAERRGPSAILRRAPLLSDFAPRFLDWVDHARHLAPKSRRYYRVGWNQIRSTPLMGMNLDRIATEALDSLALAGSSSYVNQALRTLRRLLGKAVEWNVITVAPTVKLMKEVGRELTIEPETEAKLLAVGKQPMKDILIVIQDTGMRPDEVFRIRIENIDWSRRLIFNPSGKTKAARRHVPISERMLGLLLIRCSEKREGWLFPSRRAKGGHITTVAKQFRDARSKAGLPKSLVLYCARHTFGTATYGATGNLAMVMKVMGHRGTRTAMHYQHPLLDPIREAIDQRNLRHKPRHNELRVQ